MPPVARRTQPSQPIPAKFVQVLEYMNGPQAVLAERSTDHKIVAVAIDKPGYRYPFFGAGISFEQWERYRRGFLDFRFLFMYPRWKEWYVFDLKSEETETVRLTRVQKDSFAEEHYIPEPGFFAYDHSEPIRSTEAQGLATQNYKTDGIWDLPDFTEFYHKITDLYTFHLSLKRYVAVSTPIDQKRKIRESFTGHPLRGGYSYVNLYSGLSSAQGLADRLSVGKLYYGSPGNVDVRGRLDVFAEMTTTFNEFAANYERVKSLYNALHHYLSKNKYLKADSDRFDKEGSVANFIHTEATGLARALGIENPELIYELTDKHALKYAKILLAHFRRVESYFMFFAEGRVKTPETSAPD